MTGSGRQRRSPPRPRLSAVAALVALWSALAGAHGMRLEAQAAGTPDGWIIRGQLSYTDQSPAAGNYLRVEQLGANPPPALALQTGDSGHFQLPALAGHRYRVTAQGDEGHATTIEVLVAPTTAPEAEEEKEKDGWPIYLVITALLLASLVPAHFLRRRDV